MAEQKKVRIGFVGVGGMGQCAHLKNYVMVPDCEVVALAELRPKLREAVARKYGVPRTYASGEEMLAKEKLDGIVASQMFDRHGQVVIPLYKAGVPVFTEKPLAAAVDVGERMLAALGAGGSWHMVGYHKRSDPATMYAKAEIERLKQTGELGQLKYVRLTMPSGDFVASGFADLIQTGEKIPSLPRDVEATWSDPYIAFVNYYIHQVNLLRHLLGEPYRVTFADKAAVLFVAESASGVTGTIEMTPYRTTVDWQETALVCFEKGYVKLDLPAPLASNRPGRVEMFKDPGDGVTPQTIVPQLPWIHAMRQQAINFVRAIRGEIKPLCEAAEALEDLRLARQYLQSFASTDLH
ncbi:MAG: Gfo/Idh/MocA family oxidoreductase [Kiritimatiellae bacterium]|nr:Gfo/Idh/MocA family oxidoreductase [Kiritimatiellia bacterium]